MAFATALPHEIPALIKKFRLKKYDAKWWQQELPTVTTHMSKMSPPDVSHTLWAVAKVPSKNSVAQMFKSFEPHIIDQLPHYTPRDLAILAGAYAQASVPSQTILPRIATQVDNKVKIDSDNFEPSDYVKLLQAYAKLRSKAPEILSLGTSLTPWISHLYPREVAGAVWALGHLSANPHMADPFIEEALSTGDKLNVVDVCNLAYGLGKLKSSRHLPAIGTLAVPLLPQMEPNHVATLTWALGKARVLPVEFHQHIVQTVQTYGIRDVIFVIQGIQAAGACVETWAAVCARIEQLAPKMTRIDAVHIIPALPKCPNAKLCIPVVNALDSLLQERLQPNDGIFVLQALSVLKLRPACWDPIETSLFADFPGRIPLAQWILCLSALHSDGALFRAIVEELEKDKAWTGSFRDVVATLQIDAIAMSPLWQIAADSLRLQIPKLPLGPQMLQGCIEVVKRDYCAKEILGVVIGRLQRLTEPLSAVEIEMVGLLLEEVEFFDANAWNALVHSWEQLQPRPPEFLASCAKILFRPDITLDWVQPAQNFSDSVLLLQVLVKLDYVHQIPWSKWLVSGQNEPLKTMALFLHATCFANGSLPPAVIEAFERLPLSEWDLYSAAQILTAMVHWLPDMLHLPLHRIRHMVSLLDLAEKGAQKRNRLEGDVAPSARLDPFHHSVFDALATASIRKVLCEVQAGPYTLDIVVYT